MERGQVQLRSILAAVHGSRTRQRSRAGPASASASQPRMFRPEVRGRQDRVPFAQREEGAENVVVLRVAQVRRADGCGFDHFRLDRQRI